LDYLKKYGNGLETVSAFLAIYEPAKKIATRDVPFNQKQQAVHNLDLF